MLNDWIKRSLDPAAVPAASETRRVLRRSRRMWLSARPWLRRLAVWAGAIAVAAAAIVFALGSELMNRLFQRIVQISPYLPLVVTPLGLALTVALTRRLFPGTQGSGIPQTIAALSMHDERKVGMVLSLRIALGKIGLTLLALAAGASVGREVPTVQIGASIMHAVGKLARMPSRRLERNHEMVLPLMAAALVGHGTSRLVCRRPLYRSLAEAFLQAADRAGPRPAQDGPPALPDAKPR